MGAWGTGIFDDDLALDVQSAFRDLIAEGQSPQDATQKLIQDFQASAEDHDESTTFWIALAVTQWKLGRLLPEVSSRAIELVDRGGDLTRWKDEGPGHVKKRKTALEKARDQLASPQPAAKRVRKRYVSTTDWQVGYAVSYRLKSGRLILLRVVHVDETRGERTAWIDVLRWVGSEVPTAKEIASLDRWEPKNNLGGVVAPLKAVYAMKAREEPGDRVQVVASELPERPDFALTGPDGRFRGALFGGGWPTFDEYLAREYGLS